MSTEPTRAFVAVNVPGFTVAGFEVTLYGRIWVTPEALDLQHELEQRARKLEGEGGTLTQRTETSRASNSGVIASSSSGGLSATAEHAPSLAGVAFSTPRKQLLPYNWGKFQGWVSLIVGAFAALFAIYAVTAGITMDEKSTGYAIASPLLIVSGYAFVRRKKYAVAMTYVWMTFYVVIFLFSLHDSLTNKAITSQQQGEELGKGLAEMGIGLLFWGLCAVYYRKRRLEFN